MTVDMAEYADHGSFRGRGEVDPESRPSRWPTCCAATWTTNTPSLRPAATALDPGRLAIVDVLGLGDQSPGDLARQVSLTSNLLAHHIRVLEEAGVIVRTRSRANLKTY